MAGIIPVFPIPISPNEVKRTAKEVVFLENDGFISVDVPSSGLRSTHTGFSVWDKNGLAVSHVPVVLRDSASIGFGVLELADHRLCTYLTEIPDQRWDYHVAWWKESKRKRHAPHSIPPAALWNTDGTLVSVVDQPFGRTALRLRDGRIITGHDGRKQHILNSDLTAPKRLPPHHGFVDRMVESHTGDIVSWMASSHGESAGTLWVRNGETFAVTPVRALPSGYRISDVQVLSSGDLFVLSPRDACAIVDPARAIVVKGIEIPRGHKAVWESVDGSIFLAVERKGIFRVVPENGQFTIEEHVPYKIKGSPFFLEDGRLGSTAYFLVENNTVAKKNNGTVDLIAWNTDSFTKTELRGHTGQVIGLRQLQTGKILTWSTGSVDHPSDYYGSPGNEDTSFRLWDPEGNPLAILGHPEDRRFWSLHNELSVSLWNGSNIVETVGYGRTGGAKLTFSSYKKPRYTPRVARSEPEHAARQILKDFSSSSLEAGNGLLVTLQTPWALDALNQLPLAVVKTVVAIEINDPLLLETAIPTFINMSIQVLQITVPWTVTRIDNLYGINVSELRFVRCARLEVVSGLNCNCETVTVRDCPVLTDVQIAGPLGLAPVIHQ